MAQSEDIACGLPVLLDSSSSAPGLAVFSGWLCHCYQPSCAELKYDTKILFVSAYQAVKICFRT